jgi:hypothetical protein
LSFVCHPFVINEFFPTVLYMINLLIFVNIFLYGCFLLRRALLTLK